MKKIIYNILFLSFIINVSNAQGTWTQKSSIPITGRTSAVGFSINGKGYFGTGNKGVPKYDFWEYDPVSDSWTQKADVSNLPRQAAVGFSILNKGYIGLGQSGNFNLYSDMWEYDTLLNTWSQKASIPSLGRNAATAAVVNNKAYIGTGVMQTGLCTDEWWEFDPLANIWTQKSNFPGGARQGVSAFSIGSYVYLTLGVFDSTITNIHIHYSDLWQYDPAADSWLQKSNLPDTARSSANSCFVIGTMFYVEGGDLDSNYGNTRDLWQYNPIADAWMPKADFPSTIITGAVGFSINGKGYIASGVLDTIPSTWSNELWEYTPDSVFVGEEEKNNSLILSVFPNPFQSGFVLNSNFKQSVDMSVYNSSGKKIYNNNSIFLNNYVIEMSEFSVGIYLLRINVGNNIFTKKIIKL